MKENGNKKRVNVRSKRFLRAIALVLTAVLMLSGCSSSGSGTASGGDGEKIKIGAIGPLTGDSSNGGTDELEGKQMAVADFNEAGGVNGTMVELISYDDASSASQSATAATKLITQDGVIAIVGAHNSACTLAVLEVLNKYDVPMVTPGSSATSILQSGCEWISRAFPSDDLQISALVNYVNDEFGYKKIGVIYSNDEVGLGGLNTITEKAEAKGIEVVSETFANEDKDMTAQLNKLKGQDIEALFIWCQYNPGALVMKQTRALDWDVPYFSGTCTTHEDTFQLSDNTYVGTTSTVPFTSTSTDPDIQAWVARYTEAYGTAPSQNSARAYDATMILLEAIKAADSTDAQAIQTAIRATTDYAGLQGTISIDTKTGEYIGDVMIVQAVDGGSWQYIDSASTK